MANKLPMIWMRNGDNVFRVNECDREAWESGGWEVCDAPEAPEAPLAEVLPDNGPGSSYDFAAHKVGELRAFAEAAGIEGPESLKKGELIEALGRVGFVPGEGSHVPDGGE